MVRTFLLLLQLCSLILFCVAQLQAESVLRFERAYVKTPTSMYGGMAVDQQGFVWIASTGGGAYRFDGRELKQFPAADDCLSGSMTSSIICDHDGDMWFATFSNGVTCYQKSTGQFVHFKHDEQNKNSISNNNITFVPNALCSDPKGRIWVATADGLNCYDKNTQQWQRFKHKPTEPSISDSATVTVMYSSQGIIWVGTKTGGLNRFDPEMKTWQSYTKESHNINDNWIYDIQEDDLGNLWIGTKTGGLNYFDLQTQSFTQYASSSSDEIWNLSPAQNGKIWICHVGTGMELFDPKTKTFTDYHHNPRERGSISSNSVQNIYQDPETGEVWAFHYGGEIDKSIYGQGPVRSLQHDPFDDKTLSDDIVNTVYEDKSGTIWAATARGGLNKIDPVTMECTHFIANPRNKRSIPHRNITALHDDGEGTLWLGSWGGTLSAFNLKTLQCSKHYSNNASNKHSITNCQRIKYIISDKDDEAVLWVATVGGGLDKFNKKTQRFEHFKAGAGALPHNSVTSLYDDGQGYLWIATYGGGLCVMNKQTQAFEYFRHDPLDQTSLSTDTLYEIKVDSKQCMWISSKKGLHLFDQTTKTFTRYNSQNGLPADIICAVVPFDEQLMLGSLDNGVFSFDPKTQKYKQFPRQDGSTASIFWNSCCKDRQGRMWFGGNGGLQCVDVQTGAQSVQREPRIYLTSLTQARENILNDVAPEQCKEVVLDWQNNFFEFTFTSLNFNRTQKINYAYKLEGRDANWYEAGNTNSGRYSGLAGGNYKLLLRASIEEGKWVTAEQSIIISVETPFWKSSWFSLLMLLLALSVFLLVIYYINKLLYEMRSREDAESALSQKEIDLSITLDSIGDAVIVADKRHNIVRMNPVAEKLCAIKQNTVIGTSLAKLIKICEVESQDPIPFAQLAVAEQHEHLILYNANDERIDISESSSPIVDHSNNEVGMVLVLRDISKPLDLQRRLQHSEKMDAVGQLAGGIAHDFNNMLNGILGAAQLLALRLDENDEKSHSYVDLIQTAVARSADLTGKLLTFSRKTDFQNQIIDMHAVIAETINVLARTIDKRIAIVNNSVADKYTVCGDISRLENALLNLAINARDALTEGGEITITTSNVDLDQAFCNSLSFDIIPGSYLHITVSDNGIGMDEQIIKNIFEPFFTTKEIGKGTGLGLAAVYGVIQECKGAVTVESEVGKGSTFSLYLPLTEESIAEEEENEEIRSGQGCILIVDDEALLRIVLKDALESLGYSIIEASNGKEALAQYQEYAEQIDLVILDVMMPVMDGSACYKALRELNADLPIVMASGYTDKKIVELQPDEFIHKPYQLTEISVIIHNILKRS